MHSLQGFTHARWGKKLWACTQAECIQHGLRTIAFCHTRKLCELVTAYTRETLKSSAPHLTSSISVYRAGYSPEVGANLTPSGNNFDSLLSANGNARSQMQCQCADVLLGCALGVSCLL